MTALARLLFGRLPIGWLQLSRNPARMAAALAGVAFANVLVFLQLGVLGALGRTIETTYAPFRADVLISSDDANTLADGAPIARRLMYQALAVDGVVAAAPLYLSKLDWTSGSGASVELAVYGLPPEAARFAGPALEGRLGALALPDRALIDRKSRGARRGELDDVSPARPLRFEANGHAVEAIDTVAMGAGFASDGALIVSDQTFLRLFGQRIGGTPSHILIDVEPGIDPAAAAARIADSLAGEPVQVRPLRDAIDADRRFQTSERPVGIVFGFGAAIGLLVGAVIVYQVLSTDVADHLREYATFKAMGYRHRFFLGVVFEEALVLATLGFVPAFALAMGLYAAMSAATGLPVGMTWPRAAGVFSGCLAACAASGSLAARRLRAADPADLF